MGQSPEDLFKKATALIQAGAGPQAIDLFRKPIEAGPANPVLFFYGGVSATMTGDKELAIAWLEKAADGLPDQAEVLNTCGFALFQAGRYEAAIGVLEKALLTDPKHAMAWLNMGMSCLGLAEHQKAREALLKSIDLDPNNPQSHACLAQTYLSMGMVDEFRASLEKALSINPTLTLARRLADQPYFGSKGGLQGAPARHVFMSAAVGFFKGQGRALDILEVGSYMGSSLLTWAHAVERILGTGAKITCIDPWELVSEDAYYEDMTTYLQSGIAHRIFLHNAGFVPASIKVEPVKAKSSQALEGFESGSFDIVYIDGSHAYDDAFYDIHQAKKLVRNNGLICGDDLELQAGECDAAVAQENRNGDYMTEPRTGRQFHPGVTLAVGGEMGPVSSFDGFWIMQKTEDGFIPADLSDKDAILPAHWGGEHRSALQARFANSGEIGRLIV